MARLNHLEIPDTLMEALRRRAAAHGLTVEEQAIRDLADAHRADEDERTAMDEIRRERDAMAARGVFMTDAFLDATINLGRP